MLHNDLSAMPEDNLANPKKAILIIDFPSIAPAIKTQHISLLFGEVMNAARAAGFQCIEKIICCIDVNASQGALEVANHLTEFYTDDILDLDSLAEHKDGSLTLSEHDCNSVLNYISDLVDGSLMLVATARPAIFKPIFDMPNSNYECLVLQERNGAVKNPNAIFSLDAEEKKFVTSSQPFDKLKKFQLTDPYPNAPRAAQIFVDWDALNIPLEQFPQFLRGVKHFIKHKSHNVFSLRKVFITSTVESNMTYMQSRIQDFNPEGADFLPVCFGDIFYDLKQIATQEFDGIPDFICVVGPPTKFAKALVKLVGRGHLISLINVTVRLNGFDPEAIFAKYIHFLNLPELSTYKSQLLVQKTELTFQRVKQNFRARVLQKYGDVLNKKSVHSRIATALRLGNPQKLADEIEELTDDEKASLMHDQNLIFNYALTLQDRLYISPLLKIPEIVALAIQSNVLSFVVKGRDLFSIKRILRIPNVLNNHEHNFQALVSAALFERQDILAAMLRYPEMQKHIPKCLEESLPSSIKVFLRRKLHLITREEIHQSPSTTANFAAIGRGVLQTSLYQYLDPISIDNLRRTSRFFGPIDLRNVWRDKLLAQGCDSHAIEEVLSKQPLQNYPRLLHNITMLNNVLKLDLPSANIEGNAFFKHRSLSTAEGITWYFNIFEKYVLTDISGEFTINNADWCEQIALFENIDPAHLIKIEQTILALPATDHYKRVHLYANLETLYRSALLFGNISGLSAIDDRIEASLANLELDRAGYVDEKCLHSVFRSGNLVLIKQIMEEILDNELQLPFPNLWADSIPHALQRNHFIPVNETVTTLHLCFHAIIQSLRTGERNVVHYVLEELNFQKLLPFLPLQDLANVGPACGNPATFEYLLAVCEKNNLDLKTPPENGEDILYSAIALGKTNIVRCLLRKGFACTEAHHAALTHVPKDNAEGMARTFLGELRLRENPFLPH